MEVHENISQAPLGITGFRTSVYLLDLYTQLTH